MKILYGYPHSDGYNNNYNITSKRLAHIQRLQNYGFDVKPFFMFISPNIINPTFDLIDKLWCKRDKELLSFYDHFLSEIEDCDVFYNSTGGARFHPEFLNMIPQFKVYGCNDDPESSEIMSKPTAKYYDLSAVGNIAEVETYKLWGVENVIWQPMGFQIDDYNKDLTYETILNNEREIDLFMVIDKLSRPRKERMLKIEQAFPNASFWGRGWKNGYLPSGQLLNYLQKANIGLNIHNSTGPINTRLFYLPANGVMQICDNKKYLGEVFELGKEVIGFDTIEECIDLTHYYLNHPDEARVIAANGWKRAIRDYNEEAVFTRLIRKIEELYFKHPSNTETFHQNREQSIWNKIECFKLKKNFVIKQNLQVKVSKLYRKYYKK
ncbi:glycosyltransferase family protein [Bacteroides salyersiae]|uniref:glycosyltransferase family protein n=1 Tax=Bacteroides salyersiae TaxID=291644 RepID=UPI001C8CB30C|nr:glycosyltransferase [Bacteroides salyersiae]